jgi:serine/threonine protein kinase
MEELNWEDLKLDQKLGSGSFKEVWAGSWQGEEVAIGVLRDAHQLRPTEVDEFRTEAKMLSTLRHPKILHVWGICPILPNLAIVTELCSTDLYRYLHVDATQITVPQALDLMTGIALGLSYLHGKKIAHRDLKSPNVLLTSSGSVKLGDFGLARVKQSSRSLRTQVGTPLWMAPEVIKNEPYDLSADVYSLGLIFYEILAGKLPYDGLNQMQLLMHVVMQGKRPEIDTDLRPSFRDNLPTAVTNMVKLCWVANPVRRPKIDQVVQVLKHAQLQV